jgi:hypothetical protein
MPRCVCRVELEGAGPSGCMAARARRRERRRCRALAALTQLSRLRAADSPPGRGSAPVGPLSYCSVACTIINHIFTVYITVYILRRLRFTSPCALHSFTPWTHAHRPPRAFAGMQTRHRIATEYPWRQRLVMRHMLQTRTSSAYGLEARRRTSHRSHSHPRVVPALRAAVGNLAPPASRRVDLVLVLSQNSFWSSQISSRPLRSLSRRP